MRYLVLAALIAAGSRIPDPGLPRETLAIRAGKVYTVSGGIISPGVILIEDGKIVGVMPGTRVPDGARVIDAAVVVPGLVDAFSTEAGTADAEESIAADVRAIDGYDMFADRRRTLAGGVTTTHVTPGSARLLSGQGAIVKAAGASHEARVLRASYGLRVTLGEAPKNPPGLFKPPIPPSSENPIKPMQRQYPATRMGEFAALRAHFDHVKKLANGRSPLPREAVDVTREALDGRRPLLVSARAADDLIKAIRFSGEFGLRLVLVNADEAGEVADLLAEHKLPVLLDAGISPGQAHPGDDARPTGESRRSVTTAGALAKAGIRVALHSPEDDDMRELLLIAAYAVRWGLPEDAALRAITLTPAEILGVAERVGSIEKGKDADLVLLNMEPLTGTAVVQKVLVDGALAYERNEGDVSTYRALTAEASKSREILAIRGARILTVTGGVIPDGLILAEDGKIAYVGRPRPLPKGAKLIDATGLTAAPGLIDVQSHLGLHLDQNELAARYRQRGAVPSQAAGPLSDLIRLNDPEFAQVAGAGVTTILLAPEQSGTCSLVKLGGGPKGASVVRPVAALKLQVQGGTLAYRQLKEQVERGKRYHEEWEAWEKAQKEQKEPPKPSAGGTPEKPDPITGAWDGTIVLTFGGQPMSQKFTADLKLNGTEVTGTMTGSAGGRSQSQEIQGTFEKDELKFSMRQMGAEASITLKVSGPDMLDGTFTANFQGQTINGTVSMTRTSSTPGAAPAAAQKGPRKEDALEPYRGLLRREIPAICVARDLPAIENAVKVFRDDFNVEFFILGASEADFASHVIARGGAGAAFGPDAVRERRGGMTNLAEAVASTGVPIAFCSGAQSGTRHLPLQVVHAVRHGLDGFDALKAVTSNAARLLKADTRIGALERGRDADIVLYTGDPFLLTSRIRYVIIDGKIVHETQ